jgi:hypothetical protein
MERSVSSKSAIDLITEQLAVFAVFESEYKRVAAERVFEDVRKIVDPDVEVEVSIEPATSAPWNDREEVRLAAACGDDLADAWRIYCARKAERAEEATPETGCPGEPSCPKCGERNGVTFRSRGYYDYWYSWDPGHSGEAGEFGCYDSDRLPETVRCIDCGARFDRVEFEAGRPPRGSDPRLG